MENRTSRRMIPSPDEVARMRAARKEVREQEKRKKEILTAKNEIANFLQQLRVSGIIIIDDDFTCSGKHVVDLVDGVVTAEPNSLKTCSEALGLKTPVGSHGWEQELQGAWDAAQKSSWAIESHFRITTLSPDTTRAIQGDQFPHALDLLIPESVEVFKIAPSQWGSLEHHAKRLLAKSEDSQVLCLFDQDLAKDQNSPSRDGMVLLKRFAEQFDNDRVLLALLSQTYTEEEELTEGRKLISDHKVPLSRVLPLSKYRLDAPSKVADGFRLTTLSLACARLTKQAVAANQRASTEVARKLEDLDVYDFYEIVIHSSNKEGVWEVETLFRLFNHHLRQEVRQIVHTNRTAFSSWTDHMRQNVRPKGSEADRVGKGSAWMFNRAEYYDEADVLNPFHAPVEAGDIFKLTGTDQEFIVLGQPCDLMVREDGTRGGAPWVTLAPIRLKVSDETEQEDEQAGTKDRDMARTTAHLNYYSRTSGDGAVVYFKQALTVPLEILDLCVFSKDGLCEIEVGQPLSAPVHGPWQYRYKGLQNLYRKKAEELKQFEDLLGPLPEGEAKNQLRQRLLPDTFLYGQITKATVTATGEFRYPLQRIGRYRQPRIAALLQDWAAFQSRPAFDHDVASLTVKRN